jgi:thiol-disulfide isomerase/thioredoxin
MKKQLYQFSATWCPACQSMQEDFEDFSKNYAPQNNIEVVYVDIDEQRDIFEEYSEKYGFDEIPTSIAMVEGYLYKGKKGTMNAQDLLDLFDE